MKTLPLPCGHKALPPEIVRVFGDNISSVHCAKCKKDFPYVAPKVKGKDVSIPLFPIDHESPFHNVKRLSASVTGNGIMVTWERREQ